MVLKYFKYFYLFRPHDICTRDFFVMQNFVVLSFVFYVFQPKLRKKGPTVETIAHPKSRKAVKLHREEKK